MNKTLLVLKNEFITIISRRSFLLTLVLVPLIPAVIMLVISSMSQKTSSAVGQIISGPPTQAIEGYVDQSGLIKALPQDVPPGRLIAYPDQEKARADLLQGKITAYYLLPTDYLTSGKVTLVRTDFNPLSGMDQSRIFERVIRYNLLGQDASLVNRLDQLLVLEKVSLSSSPQRDQSSLLTFFLPYGVAMLFYIVILSASGLMLSSVTNEKQNRVIEILMVSVTPVQMLTGKIIGLGLAGLLQTLVWSSAGYGLLALSGRALSVPAAFQLPPSIIFWGIIFFILGYAVYASLMAGVGALVPNLREGSQATTVLIIPLVIPLMFMSALVTDPNSGLAVGLSLFPLTAPVTMMTRLAAGGIPVWQPLLSAALLAVTAVLIVRSVAGMFRAQTLLSGQSFNLKLFFKALAGRTA